MFIHDIVYDQSTKHESTSKAPQVVLSKFSIALRYSTDLILVECSEEILRLFTLNDRGVVKVESAQY